MFVNGQKVENGPPEPGFGIENLQFLGPGFQLGPGTDEGRVSAGFAEFLRGVSKAVSGFPA